MIEYPEIFISHSHDDTDAVRRIVRRWRSWKLSVYADYLDPKLSRAKTMTGPLADHLRKKIHESLLFVFVASQQSVGSGWMPWELGLAQGAVGRVHVYLMDSGAERAYATREYMQLYPRFSDENARKHLTEAVHRARTEPLNRADFEDSLLVGMRFMKALEESRLPEALLRGAADPTERARATVLGAQLRGLLGKRQNEVRDPDGLDVGGLYATAVEASDPWPRAGTDMTGLRRSTS